MTSNDDIDGLIETDLTANPDSTGQEIIDSVATVSKTKMKHWIVKKAFDDGTISSVETQIPQDWDVNTYTNP